MKTGESREVDVIAQIGLAYEILRWEEKALIEAAKEINLGVKLLHLHVACMSVGKRSTEELGVDIILQRAISHAIALNSTLALESMGMRVLNSSITTAIAMNKLWTLKVLAQKGLPIPNTIITFDFDPSLKAAQILGYPVVIKPIDGSWGRLIAMARDEEELRALLEHRSYISNPSIKVNMIQEFVKKPGRDLRIFVVGEEVVTAIYRVSNHWITNTARGGIALPAKIDQEVEELTLKAAKAVEGEILGVDVFEDPSRGYIVNEINAIPEFKNTVKVTGVPLHRKMMEYVKNLVKR
ncbi:MAG: lysine biosynthesis protein LysX [Ignisphaera sp.]